VKRVAVVLPSVVICAVTSNCPVLASNGDARFALHRVPMSEEFDGCGTNNPNALGIPCTEYSVTAPLGESYVYIVVAGGGEEGIVAVSFGIDYDGRPGEKTGIDPAEAQFTSCTDGLYFSNDNGWGDFPKPRGGVRAWFATATCDDHPVIGESGRHALIGFLYLNAYSEDLLRLTPNLGDEPTGNALKVADCAGSIIDFVEVEYPALYWNRLGKVHFGGDGTKGYNPCGGVVPAHPNTWGKIKHLYK